MPYKVNGKFVSRETYEAHQAALAAEEENNTVSDTDVAETEVKERRTRQADPLLAAKRRLEAAKKRHAKAQKKAQGWEEIQAELEAASDELEAASDEFNAAVADVTG